MINYSDFEKVDIRVGTVIEAKLNKKSSNPSLYLIIDFGPEISNPLQPDPVKIIESLIVP